MTESKLNPFDAELLVMIGDIAKSQPEVEEKPGFYAKTPAHRTGKICLRKLQ